jgi:hypothetical protein
MSRPACRIPRLVVTLLFGLSCAAAMAQAPLCAPFLKEIRVKVGSTAEEGTRSDFHYCIYFGDEESGRIDEDTGRQHCQQTLFLLHPTVESASGMAVPAPHRWYAIRHAAGDPAPRALLEDRVWRSVPCAARHVLAALGVDDDDLLLISCQFLSGSISVCYHPRFDRDRAFYEQKLQVLQSYIAAHDLREEVPVSRVLNRHEDFAGAPRGPTSRQEGVSCAYN